jgi:hypothetical protein
MFSKTLPLNKEENPTEIGPSPVSMVIHQDDTSMPSGITPYMRMSIRANLAGRFYNFSAAICSWLVLAAFIVLPNTFTSVKSSKTLGGSRGGQVLQEMIQNVPILWLAGIFCFLGLMGTVLLWLRYQRRRNYVWLIRHIFL